MRVILPPADAIRHVVATVIGSRPVEVGPAVLGPDAARIRGPRLDVEQLAGP